MITNIIDARKRRYRWLSCDVVIEPTWHDNRCNDSDHAEKQELWPVGYDDKPNCSIAEAIAWAQTFPGNNTLYIYDAGSIFEKRNDKYIYVEANPDDYSDNPEDNLPGGMNNPIRG